MTVQRERFVRENAPKQREAKWFDQAALGQTSANGHGDRHAHMHQYTKNTQMHKLCQAPSWCRSSWPCTDILSSKHKHAPLSGLVHSGQIKTADPVFTHTHLCTHSRG